MASQVASDIQGYGLPYADVVRCEMDDRENSSRFGHVGMGKELPPIPSGSGSGYVKASSFFFLDN